MIRCNFKVGVYAGDDIPTPVDTTKPVIVSPLASSFEFVNGASGLAHTDTSLLAWVATATATDNRDGVLTVANTLGNLPNPLPTGSYNVTFSAVDKALNSSSVTVGLTINEQVDNAPQISAQPAGVTVDDGAAFTFSITATNVDTYQWQKNGVDIADANSSTFSGTAALADDGANYRCVLSGNGATVFSNAVTLAVNDVSSGGETVIADKTEYTTAGTPKVIIIGPASTVNGVITYTVTGSSNFVVGPASNEITFDSPIEDTDVLNISGDDGNGWTDSGTITVEVSAAESVIPTQIAYTGWSTMSYTLDGINTGSSTNPTDEHNPSLYKLVGQMYAANNIGGYSDDFEFLDQGSQFIDGAQATAHINSTAAQVAVLSAYGSTSGIIMEPADANVAPEVGGNKGWIDRMVSIAQTAEARNIKPIMYQCWGSSDLQGDFDHAKINTDALQAKHGMLVIRTAEMVEALISINPAYVTNVDALNGKYSIPVTTLYSGDTADNFHGSYAMAYLAALATFKCLTGISAADNAFVIPSGGASGDQYGMSAQFISDIKTQVDLIQKESLVSGLEAGAAPIANNFSRTGTHDTVGKINIVAASNLIDDVAIELSNLTIKTINTAHFSSHDLTNGVLTFTPVNTYTGDSVVVFTYTDADAQEKDITLTLTIDAAEVIPPEEIIVNFGSGSGNNFTANGNLYNHSTTGGGKTINQVRGFTTANITSGDLQDSDGVGTGSITSLSDGLYGGGYGGNADPVVVDYGPYIELYTNMAAVLNNELIEFSVNGLEPGKNYRVECGGRWGSDVTNLVSVDVNGVQGEFDCDARGPVVFNKVVKVDNTGKLTFAMQSKDNTERWGLSYLWLNKITDNTPADIPAKPVFTIHPQDVNVTQGTAATFTVSATGAPSYQWYFNGVIINGMTASTYTRTTQAGDEGGLVTVEAKNPGGDTLSNAATITLLTAKPSITVEPVATATLVDGDKLILTVTATGATKYQWKKNGVAIVGATNRELNMAVTAADDGAVFSCDVANDFGVTPSADCAVTVTQRKQEYWFAIGRSDGKAGNFDTTTNFIPDSEALGDGGESINFIKHWAPHGSPVTKLNMWRDITATVTDLSVTYNSIGSNTDTINAWGDYNTDINDVPEVVTKLTNKNMWQHKNLFAYHVYMSSNHAFELTFENGGLIIGEVWKVQLLGLHYQDENRPVDVQINGIGEAGNMHVGDWDTLDVFEALATVNASGQLVVTVSPQVNANINTIKLIKV